MGKRDKSAGPKIAPGFRARDRVPRANPPSGGWNSTNPVWCFHARDRDGPFAWKVPDSEAGSLLRKLEELGCLTWSEILVQNEKHNHPIATTEICKAARDRLVALAMDDVDEVISFRVNAKVRFFAVRHDHYALLLWWDPEHQVYPTKPRNT